MNSTVVISNNSEALQAFTLLTANSLLNCSTKPIIHYGRPLPTLRDFIQHLYSPSKKTHAIPCAVKVVSLIYLLRLKSKLPDNARGGFDTPYRLLLAAILTSSKYLSETGTGLTSMYLSLLTDRLYTPKEINRMERSFLGLLRYDLWVSFEDIQSFMNLYGDLIQVDFVTKSLTTTATTTVRCLDNNNSSTTEISRTNQIGTTSTTNTATNTTTTAAVAVTAVAENKTNTTTATTISPHPA
ncbi:MAG: hypothetical protein EXX96DRAFT_559766 [Benjaminiella poitrasii]|nr:MAG: hypothetical protein EXX96DRAFT_559766 [Benjaminiella poitrasii]